MILPFKRDFMSRATDKSEVRPTLRKIFERVQEKTKIEVPFLVEGQINPSPVPALNPISKFSIFDLREYQSRPRRKRAFVFEARTLSNQN